MLLCLGGKRVCHDLSPPFAFDFELMANGCKVDGFALAIGWWPTMRQQALSLLCFFPHSCEYQGGRMKNWGQW